MRAHRLAAVTAVTMLVGGCHMGMMHRMMSRGSHGPAPAATARAASAAACPDITQELVDRGRDVFARAGNCFACHGADAAGSSLAPDLTDSEWLIADGSYASIEAVVRTGVSKPRQFPAPMPPMGGGSLSKEQTCAVAAYVHSLGRAPRLNRSFRPSPSSGSTP